MRVTSSKVKGVINLVEWGRAGKGAKEPSRVAIATKLTILVDQRETPDEEDEGEQQPQVVQTAQKGEKRRSDLCKAPGV